MQTVGLADFVTCASLQLIFASLPTLESLEIDIDADRGLPLEWQDDMDTQWLELLHLFTFKDLYLSESLVPSIASALQELSGERVMEVLPALQNLFLAESQPSESVKEAIRKFIAARQLSGCPVTVHRLDNETWEYERWEVGDRQVAYPFHPVDASCCPLIACRFPPSPSFDGCGTRTLVYLHRISYLVV
jgi:hypothetical protein